MNRRSFLKSSGIGIFGASVVLPEAVKSMTSEEKVVTTIIEPADAVVRNFNVVWINKRPLLGSFSVRCRLESEVLPLIAESTYDLKAFELSRGPDKWVIDVETTSRNFQTVLSAKDHQFDFSFIPSWESNLGYSIRAWLQEVNWRSDLDNRLIIDHESVQFIAFGYNVNVVPIKELLIDLGVEDIRLIRRMTH